MHLLDGEVILQSIPRVFAVLTLFAFLATGITCVPMLPFDGYPCWPALAMVNSEDLANKGAKPEGPTT